MKDLPELIDEWCKENRAHCWEGTRGVDQFEKLCKVLGYKEGNYFGDVLRNFLSDNSGAIEALLDWIGNTHMAEWKENIESELPEPSEEGEEQE